MPRTKLSADYNAKRIEKIIRIKIIEQNLRQSDLAGMINMPPTTFYRKLKTGSWSYSELLNIAKYLNFNDDDKIKVLSS